MQFKHWCITATILLATACRGGGDSRILEAPASAVQNGASAASAVKAIPAPASASASATLTAAVKTVSAPPAAASATAPAKSPAPASPQAGAGGSNAASNDFSIANLEKGLSLYGSRDAWTGTLKGNRLQVSSGSAPDTKLHVKSTQEGQTIRFNGKVGTKDILLEVQPTACQDSNNASHPLSVTLYIGSRPIKGCADYR